MPSAANALGITNYGPQNEADKPVSLLFGLPVLTSGGYTITPTAEAGKTEYNTSVTYGAASGGFYAEVTSAAPVTETVSSTGTVVTSCDSAAAQTVTTSVNGATTQWYYTDVSGTTTGMTVAPSASETSVKTADANKVTIKTGSDLSEITFPDVDASLTGVTVKADTDGKCAVFDNDAATSVSLQSAELGYSVVFDSQYGSNVDARTNVPSGTTITAPANPTRAGYIFGGWYKDKGCTTAWDFSTDTVTADTVLYAGWTEDPNYLKTVTLSVDGCDDQLFTVPVGTKLSSEQLGLDSYSDMDVNWSNSNLETDGLTVGASDVNVTGTAVPETDGTTLSFSNAPKYSGGMLSFEIRNSASASFGVYAVAAAYSANGRLLSVQQAAPTIVANGVQTLSMDFSAVSSAASFKVFLFYSGSDSRIPLCQSKSVAVS